MCVCEYYINVPSPSINPSYPNRQRIGTIVATTHHTLCW